MLHRAIEKIRAFASKLHRLTDGDRSKSRANLEFVLSNLIVQQYSYVVV